MTLPYFGKVALTSSEYSPVSASAGPLTWRNGPLDQLEQEVGPMTQKLFRIILQVLVVLPVPPAAFAVAADRDFVLRWTAVDGAPPCGLVP
jgi:hypothetical protein